MTQAINQTQTNSLEIARRRYAERLVKSCGLWRYKRKLLELAEARREYESEISSNLLDKGFYLDRFYTNKKDREKTAMFLLEEEKKLIAEMGKVKQGWFSGFKKWWRRHTILRMVASFGLAGVAVGSIFIGNIPLAISCIVGRGILGGLGSALLTDAIWGGIREKWGVTRSLGKTEDKVKEKIEDIAEKEAEKKTRKLRKKLGIKIDPEANKELTKRYATHVISATLRGVNVENIEKAKNIDKVRMEYVGEYGKDISQYIADDGKTHKIRFNFHDALEKRARAVAKNNLVKNIVSGFVGIAAGLGIYFGGVRWADHLLKAKEEVVNTAAEASTKGANSATEKVGDAAIKETAENVVGGEVKEGIQKNVIETVADKEYNSVTRLARKAIFEYMKENNIKLTQEQVIKAEWELTQTVINNGSGAYNINFINDKHWIAEGQEINFRIEDIKEAIGKAEGRTFEYLKKHCVSRVNWERWGAGETTPERWIKLKSIIEPTDVASQQVQQISTSTSTMGAETKQGTGTTTGVGTQTITPLVEPIRGNVPLYIGAGAAGVGLLLIYYLSRRRHLRRRRQQQLAQQQGDGGTGPGQPPQAQQGGQEQANAATTVNQQRQQGNGER